MIANENCHLIDYEIFLTSHIFYYIKNHYFRNISNSLYILQIANLYCKQGKLDGIKIYLTPNIINNKGRNLF